MLPPRPRVICTELEIHKRILRELATEGLLQCSGYAQESMRLRIQWLEEKKELFRLQKEKKELSNTKDNFIKLKEAQDRKKKADKSQDLSVRLTESIKAKEEVDRLSKLVENQTQAEVQTAIDDLDKSIKDQTKKINSAKEAYEKYKKKYYQAAREFLKTKEKRSTKGGEEKIYSRRDEIYSQITSLAERRTETEKARLEQQKKARAKLPKPITTGAKEREQLEERIQDFLANLPEIINTALEAAIDTQKKGFFIGILANLGGGLAAANIGLDFKNILEAELHIPTMEELAKVDPNRIVQSNAVGKLLTSDLTWDTVLLVLPKLLDVIKRYQTEVDDVIWGVINEESSINDESKMLLAKLILGNEKALNVIITVVSGVGTDVILDFLHNSATLAPYIESLGVSSDNIDRVVKSFIPILSSLPTFNQALLALISTESLEEKIKSGLLIAKNEGLIDRLSQLVLTCKEPVAEVLVKYSGKLEPFGLNPGNVRPLMEGVLTFASGVIKKLPQIAPFLEKNAELLSSIIQSGDLEGLRALTAEQQAELIDDIFSVIKEIDPATLLALLQDGQALKNVADIFIQTPFFKANVLDNITKMLGIPKGAAQTKAQALILNLIAGAIPIALSSASFLLKKETLEKIQDIIKKVPQLLSKETPDEAKEKAMLEIINGALGLLAEEDMMDVIARQLPQIILANAEPIVAEVLEENPEILKRFGLDVGLDKDKQAINALVKISVNFVSDSLKKAPQVIAILQKHSEIYSALMSSAVMSGMHGFSVAGLLEMVENEHLAVIADDVLSIIREIDPATLLQGPNKEALKSVASSFIQSPFFQEKVLDVIPKELGVSDAAVKKLATEAVSVVLDAASFLLKEETLGKVQEIIEKIPLLLSKDEGQEVDKKKETVIFEIIDNVFKLLDTSDAINVYDGVAKLIESNEEVFRPIIQSMIDKSPLKGKIDLTAKNVLNIISNPEAFKVAKEAYDLYRTGHAWKAIYTAVTGVMSRRNPELGKIVLSVIHYLLTEVFQKTFVPNFLRRLYIGNSINDVITSAQTNKRDGVIQDLADILLKGKTSDTGIVANYSINNKFLSGLNFGDINFYNLKIDGFSFNGATFGSGKESTTSFANSVITGTDFKDVNFKSNTLDFTNATIDLGSLKTLAKFFKSPRVVSYEGMKLLSPKITPEDRKELIDSGLSEDKLNKIVENTKVSVLMALIKNELGGEEDYNRLSQEQKLQIKKNIELIVKTAGEGEESKFDKIATPDMFKSFTRQLTKDISALSSSEFNEGKISDALTKHCEIIKRAAQPVEAIRHRVNSM